MGKQYSRSGAVAWLVVHEHPLLVSRSSDRGRDGEGFISSLVQVLKQRHYTRHANQQPVMKVRDRVELVLPDGRTIDYAIQISPKSRSLRATKLSARDGMVIVAPPNLDHHKLLSMGGSEGGLDR